MPTGNADYSEINVIIEIPNGSAVKYEYDNEHGCVAVDRLLKTPLNYNFNYGDIPQTWNEGDNDPLDAIVLSRASFYPGVVVPCRVIGGLKMWDNGEFDYKVLAVADDPYYTDVKTVEDVQKKELEDIEYFMLHYKDLENKTVELKGWDGPAEAKKIIEESVAYYPVKMSQND